MTWQCDVTFVAVGVVLQQQLQRLHGGVGVWCGRHEEHLGEHDGGLLVAAVR